MDIKIPVTRSSMPDFEVFHNPCPRTQNKAHAGIYSMGVELYSFGDIKKVEVSKSRNKSNAFYLICPLSLINHRHI